MITRKFIEKVHFYFDELNYHITDDPNYDAFENATINTLVHCEELNDAIETINMYRFCTKKWRKIERLFRKKNEIYNQYAYEGNNLLTLVSDENAFGTYYITNAITNKYKTVFMFSHSFDDEYYTLYNNHNRFFVKENSYYLKYNFWSSSEMKLCDKDGHTLCNIVLSTTSNIFLEKNRSPYELVIHDNFIGIYSKEYYDSLKDSDLFDCNMLVADLEWDIISKNSDFGVTKLNIYSENADTELLFLFASATFLVYHRYISAKRSATIATNYALLNN